MKIAFAHWNNRIAPVFDTARRIHIVETNGGAVIGEVEEELPEAMTVLKVLRLVDLKIDVLVCGAISRSLHGHVSAYGIRVVPFVAGGLRKIIQAWLEGILMRDVFAMPGCRGRSRQRYRGISAHHREIHRMRTPRRHRGGERYGAGIQRNASTNEFAMPGAAAYCICPGCGLSVPHAGGVPCVERECPACGIVMKRG
ncbi:MAG: NifB/NifX family molybdenum-iron cluster-binding protein [Desulfobacterales bacterium]